MEEQIQWLQRENAIEKIRNQKPNGDISKSIIQLPKDLCSGCGACDNACPINAINMEEDEYGFLYPSVDREKCRNCGYCANVCPRLNLRYKNSEKKFVWQLWQMMKQGKIVPPEEYFKFWQSMY